ncbi:MAG: hypothetical protein M1835_000516 [Candelina submexicana]|nr:MAG: hypothetical protein M1835_000516 [Candelina submexicana]
MSMATHPGYLKAQTQQATRHEPDSEWEYEYDDAETESIYLVLDLSSSGQALGPRGKAKKKSKPKPAVDADLNKDDPVRNGDRSATQSPFHREELSEQRRVQILDLHTPKPIVSYQNRVYNCDWTNTIGTDLLLARPSTQSDSAEHTDLRSRPNYSLVATSAVKLLGNPAQLVAKQEVRTRQQDATGEQATTEGGQGTDGDLDHTSVKASALVEAGANRSRQSQGSFLERLAVAKSAKGEQDEVTLVSKKLFTKTGWRAQQNRRRREGTGDSSDHGTEVSWDGEDTAIEEEEPSRKKRKPSTGAFWNESGWTRGGRGKGRWHRADGGLIRANRPGSGNEPDADDRPTFTTTPKTLDEMRAATPHSLSNGAQAGVMESPSYTTPGSHDNNHAVTTPTTPSRTAAQATSP